MLLTVPRCATLLTFNASTHTELFPRFIIGVMVLGVMQHKIPIARLPVSCGTVYILAGTSTQRLDTHYKAISCMSETLSCWQRALVISEGDISWQREDIGCLAASGAEERREYGWSYTKMVSPHHHFRSTPRGELEHERRRKIHDWLLWETLYYLYQGA